MAKKLTNPNKSKHAGGRPRTKTPKTFTAAQLRRIDEMAMAQCKDTTIAEAMGFDVDTFREDLSSRTHKKRQEGKVEILQAQFKGCKEKSPGAVTERIWWGKQHLAQTDRQEVALSELPPIQIVLNAGPEERKG